MIWLTEAKRHLGLREIKGPKTHPTIQKWIDELKVFMPRGDDDAWCGLFVGHCIKSTLPGETIPVNPLGAQNWKTFGVRTVPTIGCILVFWRESPRSWKGHVGFYVGEDTTSFYVLGGNQADSVSVSRIAKTRLLAARWPATIPVTAIKTVQMRSTSELSRNEA